MGDKMIMYDSKDAATYKTGISGWVDRSGFFHGENEDQARWSGCTHRKCECGQIHRKSFTCCKSCREKHAEIKFNNLISRVWDNESVIYSNNSDIYFSHGIDEVIEHCRGLNINPGDLQLLHCEPVPLPSFDISDIYCDVLSEDQDEDDIPDAVLKAAEYLKDAINASAPISFTPGFIRVDLSNSNI